MPDDAHNRETTYTIGYGSEPHAMMTRRSAGNAAAFLLPHLRPGMRLLDCGCGPGTITLGLAEAVAPGKSSPLTSRRFSSNERSRWPPSAGSRMSASKQVTSTSCPSPTPPSTSSSPTASSCTCVTRLPHCGNGVAFCGPAAW